MSLILGLDLETSGVDPAVDQIIEVGAALWDHETKVPVKLLSEFIEPLDNFEISPEIQNITGISNEQLRKWGLPQHDVLRNLRDFAYQADYVMAHFGTDFDKLFLMRAFAKEDLDFPWDLTWIDTSIDIVFPPLIKTRNLKHLAAEHGFISGFSHRAVFDVLTMLRIASQYDLDAMVARAREPIVYMQALVSYDQRELAKARGYWWQPQHKIWWRSFKESDSLVERETCGFRTSLLLHKPEESK